MREPWFKEVVERLLLKHLGKKVFLAILIILMLFLTLKGALVTSWGPSSNYENVSVRTTVNVTNAIPEILNIVCNNGANITLNAGSTFTLTCLIEIRDYSGGNTINSTNGTFYYNLNESSDPDDNNTHYTNSSCTENNTNGFYTNWTCIFDVLYYANNGTWEANITVMDDYNKTANDYVNISIYSLLALNVTSVINFGDMQVGDYSSLITANITNFGNMDINVSLYGFGGDDEVTGAGVAMICEVLNITLPNERYTTNASEAYADMTPITGAAVTIPELTIPQQTNDSQKEINGTYWRLYVNESTNPYGECNGTVVFAAESP